MSTLPCRETKLPISLTDGRWRTDIQRLPDVRKSSKRKLFSSVQFSRSVLSDSLQPGETQHARPPCPSPTPRVYSNSCPLSRWCHLTISSSVVPFSSCLKSFPTSESLQMSQLFASGGQNIGVSVSTSVLAINTRDWFPLGWTGWILTIPKLTQANKTGIRNLE